jgi:hypothetical protein
MDVSTKYNEGITPVLAIPEFSDTAEAVNYATGELDARETFNASTNSGVAVANLVIMADLASRAEEADLLDGAYREGFRDEVLRLAAAYLPYDQVSAVAEILARRYTFAREVAFLLARLDELRAEGYAAVESLAAEDDGTDYEPGATWSPSGEPVKHCERCGNVLMGFEERGDVCNACLDRAIVERATVERRDEIDAS